MKKIILLISSVLGLSAYGGIMEKFNSFYGWSNGRMSVLIFKNEVDSVNTLKKKCFVGTNLQKMEM